MAGDSKGTDKTNTPNNGTKTPADSAKKSVSSAGSSSKSAPSAGKSKTPETKPDAKTEALKSAEQVKDAPKKKSGGGKFAWLLVFLLLFFIGGVAATPYLLPQVMPYIPEQAKAYFAPLTQQTKTGGAEVAGLTAKVNQLDATLKDVRQMASSAQEAAATRPDVTSAAGDADVSALTARLDGLASQLDQLATTQTQQGESFTRLQSNLQDIPTGEGGGVSPAAVATLKAQLDDTSSARQALAGDVKSLTDRLAALTATVDDSQSDTASAKALGDVATALRERLTRLEERLDVVAQAADSAAAPEALDNVNTAVDTAISDFETRLVALENVRQQATAAMVAGLETARLAQAVGNGRAYAAELKALAQLKTQAGPALPDISDLLADIQGFAETGIPSGATLSAQLESRSREILTAIDTPDGANWWERLLARLRNLVTVRSVGAGAEGAAPPDVLARAEVAARSGNWDVVVSEINTLPEAAKDSFGTWWDQAQARATAQRALADLNARLGVAASTTDGESGALGQAQ